VQPKSIGPQISNRAHFALHKAAIGIVRILQAKPSRHFENGLDLGEGQSLWCPCELLDEGRKLLCLLIIHFIHNDHAAAVASRRLHRSVLAVVENDPRLPDGISLPVNDRHALYERTILPSRSAWVDQRLAI